MQELVNAYLNTSYQVHLRDAWQLIRIRQDPAYHDVLTPFEWLIITACNPHSKPLRNPHNFVRHCLLSQFLRVYDLTAYPSRSR